MAKDLYEQFDEVRSLYQTANDILGFDLTQVCFEGPEEKLKQTRVTQPAIFVHSAAVTGLLRERGRLPEMTAGHSLGEYSALYAAEALTFEDALRLVKVRAELMQKAGEIEPGTMAAVIGLSAEELTAVCEEASAAGVVTVANYNSPGQLVISGSVAGVEQAMVLAKERGAKRAIPLVVSGAFHSPLMEHALAGLEQALAEVPISAPICPVYANVDARPTSEPERIRSNLKQQLTSPVRWTETIQNMIADGATRFFEVGPGTVLTGLLKRIDRQVPCSAIGGVDALNQMETA